MASHCAESPMNPRHDQSHPPFRLSTGEGSSVRADVMKHAFVDETRASRWVSEQPAAQPLAITRLNSGPIVVDTEVTRRHALARHRKERKSRFEETDERGENDEFRRVVREPRST